MVASLIGHHSVSSAKAAKDTRIWAKAELGRIKQIRRRLLRETVGVYRAGRGLPWQFGGMCSGSDLLYPVVVVQTYNELSESPRSTSCQ